MTFDLLSLLPIAIVVALVALAIIVVRGQRRKVRDIGVVRSTRTTSAPMQPAPEPVAGPVAEFPPPRELSMLTAEERSAIPWLQDIFRSEILQQTGIDLTGDKLAMQRITEAVVHALLELRRVEQTMVELPFIAADARGPKHFRRELTRIEAEAAQA